MAATLPANRVVRFCARGLLLPMTVATAVLACAGPVLEPSEVVPVPGPTQAPAWKLRPVIVLAPLRRFEVERAMIDDGHLWIPLELVQGITGFEPKPEGLCVAQTCVPMRPAWRRTFGPTSGRTSKDGSWLDLSAFAKAADIALVAGDTREVWSISAPPAVLRSSLSRGHAPDFRLPDRRGKTVRLADFRGKKVLLLTWASW